MIQVKIIILYIEILEILNEGTEGESADEFLDNMEVAADKVMELYEEEEFGEDTIIGGLLKWITDLVNQVFNILLDFLNDTDV